MTEIDRMRPVVFVVAVVLLSACGPAQCRPQTSTGLRFGLGFTEGRRYSCSNFLNGQANTSQLYDATTPFSTRDDARTVHMCSSAIERPLPIQVVLKVEDKTAVLFDTFDGLVEEVILDAVSPGCAGNRVDCRHWLGNAPFFCFKDGEHRVNLELYEEDVGTVFYVVVEVHCNDFTFGTFGDITHVLLAGLPFIYTSVMLLHYLGFSIAVLTKWRDFIPKSVSKGRLRSTVAWLIRMGPGPNIFAFTGVFIVFFVFGKMALEKIASDHQNFMHLNIGIFFILMSIMEVMIITKVFGTKSVQFPVPMMLISVGIFFLSHDQYNAFEYFLHRLFGVLVVVAGSLYAISRVWPQWVIGFLLVAQLASILFMSASPYFAQSARAQGIGGHNYSFMVININLVYTILLIGVAKLLTKLFPRVFEYQTGEETYSELGGDHEMEMREVSSGEQE